MSYERAVKNQDEFVVTADRIGKAYRIYRRPIDRLWQLLWPRKKAWATDFIALDDVSFNLRHGEVLGIVGLNGAGKSTLLQLLAGTLMPSHGSVVAKGRIAAILELGSGFNPDFTGRENIYLNAATLGLGKAEIDARMDSIIQFAGIGSHIEQPVKTYSSGMVVRLAFSIATSVDPDVLIIDEALSVGDGIFRRRSFDRIMEIKERGATIIFCSHVLFHVKELCDTALWLHQGKLRKLGPVADVITPYQEFLDAVGDTPDLPLPAMGPAADAQFQQLPLAEPMAAQATPSGEAQIREVRVSLDRKTGTELHGFSLRSTLEVEIEFASDNALPAPTAALVLSSDSGQVLGSWLSLTQGLVFHRDPTGAGVARIVVDRIPLNAGRYRVGVYLFCERGLHGYAMSDPCAFITLEHGGRERGALLLEGAWGDGAQDRERGLT